MESTAYYRPLGHAERHDEDVYLDEHDRNRHRHSMETVASEVDRPVEEVSELYEDVLRQLASEAAIPDYLPVLVSKRVRQIYRSSE